MDNRRQSFPKVAYGLGGYGRTFATGFFSLDLNVNNVTCQGHAKFSKIKKGQVFSYRLDVLIKPARDLRRTSPRTA